MLPYISSVVLVMIPSCHCYSTPSVDCIPKLIATISLNPSMLHVDETPSVLALIQIGKPAIRPVLELMLADDGLTRLRAERVLQSITAKQFGYDGREGWPSEAHRARWLKYWKDVGDLNFKDTLEKRKISVKKWKMILEDQQKKRLEDQQKKDNKRSP